MTGAGTLTTLAELDRQPFATTRIFQVLFSDGKSVTLRVPVYATDRTLEFSIPYGEIQAPWSQYYDTDVVVFLLLAQSGKC